MKVRTIGAKIALTALSAAVSFSPAMAQVVKRHPATTTQLYAFHTRPASGCPGLDWHVTVDPDGHVTGFVGWDRMQHMARLDGQVAKDNTFKIEGQEVGNPTRTATITGRAGGTFLAMSISGTGTPCDDVVLNVPRVAGGLGGGGG